MTRILGSEVGFVKYGPQLPLESCLPISQSATHLQTFDAQQTVENIRSSLTIRSSDFSKHRINERELLKHFKQETHPIEL